MPLISSRRCLILTTVVVIFWLVSIGTIVSHPTASSLVSGYRSKFGLSSLAPSDPSTPIPKYWLRIKTPSQPQLPILESVRTHAPTPEISQTHHEISSHSLNPSGDYFRISFGPNRPAINPNLIPHPRNSSLWIAVAQEFHGSPGQSKEPVTPWSVELACEAAFSLSPSSSTSSSSGVSIDGRGAAPDAGVQTLSCISPPSILPIAATPWSPSCPPDLEILNLNVGPHDARVFLSPSHIPYATFGSQARKVCFGQFLQDFRYLFDWGAFRRERDDFVAGTELERPRGEDEEEIGAMQKNFFVFWDFEGNLFAHYDLHPRRRWAEIDARTGKAKGGAEPRGRDAEKDAECWAKHLERNPLPEEGRAGVHQATNSLAVTLCRRGEEGCEANRGNTVLLHIFQHKIYTGMFRSRYEPFVALFAGKRPFGLRAIGERPIWVRGREGEGQMLYVTSISWRDHGMGYQGFLDDVVLVTFGIDDRDTGAIDVSVEELLGEMMEC